jgi:hypothetical protein
MGDNNGDEDGEGVDGDDGDKETHLSPTPVIFTRFEIRPKVVQKRQSNIMD